MNIICTKIYFVNREEKKINVYYSTTTFKQALMNIYKNCKIRQSISSGRGFALSYFFGGAFLKQVYISSPLQGDYDTCICNVVEYCRLAAESGVLALSSHIMFGQWYSNKGSEKQEQRKLGLTLLAHSDELWVMGKQISEDMHNEIEFAAKHNIPIFYIRHPTLAHNYPISTDGNALLSERDCILSSHKENYKGKLLILGYESLAVKYRTPLNQLWLCTHGSGCSYNYKFSDTIHLVHVTDSDHIAIARSEVLGVSSQETFVRLSAIYPELENKIIVFESRVDQDEDISR